MLYDALEMLADSAVLCSHHVFHDNFHSISEGIHLIAKAGSKSNLQTSLSKTTLRCYCLSPPQFPSTVTHRQTTNKVL